MITPSEKVLEIFINKLFLKYDGMTEILPSYFLELKHEIRRAMVDWADAQSPVRIPWRFNPPVFKEGCEYGRPNDTGDFLTKEQQGAHHEIAKRVRPTGYDEVSLLLGTAGCAKEKPYWIHRVMGVLETSRGKLVLVPGDWVIEVTEGVYLVLDDVTYRKLYLDV